MMRLKSIAATLLSGGLMAASLALPMGLVSHAAGQPDHGQSQVASSTNGKDQTSIERPEGTVSEVSATSLTLTSQGKQESGLGSTVTGQTYTYTLASPLTVMYRGQPLALSSVAVGSQVSLSLNATGQVSAINVQKLAMTVSGTVVSVDKGHRVTVQEANGSQVVVQIKEKAAITGVGGVNLKMSQLAVGDAVTITGMSQEKGLMATSVSVTMMVTATTTTSSLNGQQKQDAKDQTKVQNHSKDQGHGKGKDHGNDHSQSLQTNVSSSTSLSIGQDN